MDVAATGIAKPLMLDASRGRRRGPRQYATGGTLVADYPSAYKWLKKASDLGDARATAGLGELFELGLGLPLTQGGRETWGLNTPTLKPDYGRAKDLYLKCCRGTMMAQASEAWGISIRKVWGWRLICRMPHVITRWPTT